MELEVKLMNPIIGLDRLIRRMLLDHYIEIQPPAGIWESIQQHLSIREKNIPENLVRGQKTEKNRNPYLG